jgi:hypothetical protein
MLDRYRQQRRRLEVVSLALVMFLIHIILD